MDHPPVNALPVQGWYDVADAMLEAGADPATKVVVLRAEGKGFNAGVDIKEMQNTTGFDALIGANKGCFAAFKAVYECAVPVIAAVQRLLPRRRRRPGRQLRHRGRERRRDFGVPEVNQGALGAATHLARLVPQHLMRTLYFTARTIPAADLVQHGSVYEVVPRDRLDDLALGLAAEIAAKDGRVIRAAKEALNGIDPIDVNTQLPLRAGIHVGAEPDRRDRRAPRRLRRYGEGKRQQ